MARIAIAANSTWNLQNFRAGLIRELIRQGHDVITISPDAKGVIIEKERLPHRICAMAPGSVNPAKDLSYAFRLWKILRNEKTEVFISYTIKPNIYGSIASRMLNVRAIPNVSGLGAAFLGGSALMKIVTFLYRFAFARTSKVFFQNPDDKRLFVLRGLVRANQGELLPGSGVNLAWFEANPLPTQIRFLMIARLLADKGVREYVSAAEILRQRYPAAEFLLLGPLDAQNPSRIRKDELERWKNEGFVHYLGHALDVRPFIARSTAVVLPSYREGLPRTLLEAAAMGRPLIGTDVPGCREVIRDGVTGFLCEPRDVTSLAKAMERFADASYDERLALAANARLMAENEFNEKFVIQAYMRVIRES